MSMSLKMRFASVGLSALCLAAVASAQVQVGSGSAQPVVYATDHFVVSFKVGTSPAVKNAIASRYNLKIDQKRASKYFTVYTLSTAAMNAGITPLKMVNALKGNPAVAYAERDAAVTPDFIPNDPMYGDQWHLDNTGQSGGTNDADIDAPEAWDETDVHPEIIVAICDDGVDWQHEDLNAMIWLNPNETANGLDDDNNGLIDDIRGWDFADGDNNPFEPGWEHGTHVAGLAAAINDNGVGVSGAGRNTKIMALRHYAGQGSWMSDLANAIDYAWENGASVINVSYNIDGFTQTLVDAIIRAGNNNVVYCNSAGNNSQQDPPRQQIRNMADNSIFVVSTNSTDDISWFSNYGSLCEIGSPGEDVLSTLPGDSYGLNSGTSMATPLFAGCVAVLRAMDPSLSPREALDVMIGAADDVSQLEPFIENGARVNLANSVTGTGGGGATPPTGGTVVMGTTTTGSFADLAGSDDTYWKIASTYFNGRGQYAVVDLNFVSSKTNLEVKRMRLNLESNVDQPGVTQFVHFFNWTTGQYELVDTQRMAGTDLELEIDASQAKVKNYVKPGTSDVVVRLQTFQALRRKGGVPQAFNYGIDLAKLKTS